MATGDGEPIIYVGPTDKRLGLRSKAIYSGDIPEHLRDKIESNPALANYFQPLARYAARTRKRRTAASAREAVSATLSRGNIQPRTYGPPIKKRR
jgi:hypothetical protein